MKRNFGGMGNTGLGLLGAAPAQMNQGYGGMGAGPAQLNKAQMNQGYGGSGGMGQNAQMGVGGRPQIGGGSQFRGSGQQMGTGDGQAGKKQPEPLMGEGINRRRNVAAFSDVRNRPRPNARKQSRSLLADPSSYETDYGYGEEQSIPGGAHSRNIPKGPVKAQRPKPKGILKTSAQIDSIRSRGQHIHSQQKHNYQDTNIGQGQPLPKNRRSLLGSAPSYGEYAEEYQEEQHLDTWPPVDKRNPLLSETQQYPEESQEYQEEQVSQYYEQGYQDEGYSDNWPTVDKGFKPNLGETPKYDETQQYLKQQYGNQRYSATQVPLKGRKPPLRGTPQNRKKKEGHLKSWPPSDRRREPILGEAPQYAEQEQYPDNWAQSDTSRKAMLGTEPPYTGQTQVHQAEEYTDTWHHGERKGLLGHDPSYGAEAPSEQYAETTTDGRRGLLGNAPDYAEKSQVYGQEYYGEASSVNRRGILGETPYVEESQEYQQEQYAEMTSGSRRGLLGDVPHVEESQKYQQEQYAETASDNRRGLLGDAPHVEGSQEYHQEQYDETSNRMGLLGDAPYVEDTQNYREEGYDRNWSKPSNRKGLLGDAPDVGSNQEYQEEHYVENWPKSDNRSEGLLGEAPGQEMKRSKGLLGKAPGQEKKTEAFKKEQKKPGENFYQRPGQQRRGGGRSSSRVQVSSGSQSYTDEEYSQSYPDEKAALGMGAMRGSGMQQRTQTGMNQMGISGRIGAGNQMGVRAGNQMGSDQYRMGDMERQFNDNRRGSGGSGVGLLGSGTDQGLMGYGDQAKSLVNPRPLVEDTNLLAQQLAQKQQQERQQLLLKQQEEQLRAANLLKQQQQQQQHQQQQQQQQQQHQQQQQQQRMQRHLQTQRQQMQSSMMGKADGLLGEAPMPAMLGQGQRIGGGGAGTIPSLFDMKGGNRLPGKRPGDRVNRPGDKRPRRELSPDRRRGFNRPGTQKDRQDRQQQDRGSGQRRSRFDQSPVSQKKDQRQSDSRRSSVSHRDDKADMHKDRKDSANADKKGSADRDKKDVKGVDRAKDSKTSKAEPRGGRTVNTQITVTIGGDTEDTDKYDPASPTADVELEEDMETEADELKIDEEEVLQMINIVEDDDVVIIEDSIQSDSMAITETDKSKDEEEVEKEGKPNESNLTVTVTKHKKGRSVNDADGKPKEEPKKDEKLYNCNVCQVRCYSEKSFSAHLSGMKHKRMMETVMTVSEKRSKEIEARMKAESHLRKIEGDKQKVAEPKDQARKDMPVRKALESECRTCVGKFTGAYKDHKETPEHRGRESRSRAGCKLCSIPSFSNYRIFSAHLESDLHKKDSCPKCHLCKQWFKSPRKFVQHCKTDHHVQNKQKHRSRDEEDIDELSELVTLDVVGFDDDAMDNKGQGDEQAMDVTAYDKSKSMTINLEPLTPMFTKAQATSTPKPTAMLSKDIEIPENHDPDIAVGQTYVIPVSGYFCKLCHKFYNTELPAKTTHCQSKQHFEKYKQAMVVKAYKKLKEEESVSKIKDSTVGQMEKEDQTVTVDQKIAEQQKVQVSSELVKDTTEDQKVKESKSIDQSVSVFKTPDQSNASNYETADEHQEATIQKTTESTENTLGNAEKQLVNGSTVEAAENEDSKLEEDKDNIEHAQENDNKTETEVLIEKSEDVVEIKGTGRGTPSTRGSRGGGGSRNKARRARR